METPENRQEIGGEEELQSTKPPEPIFSSDVLKLDTWKRFFSSTGGSVFYCLSAVFVAYGIVKLLGPVLAESKTLADALPCIFTLHIYELALLGVLILIVCKKVVDDAISLVMIIGLFLVGTSIVQGSVSDLNTAASLFLGLGGIAIAFGKFYFMRRFVKIPFRMLCLAGLGILMVYNYLGPVFLARSIAVDPIHELVRRNQWLLVYVCMLVGAVFVIVEAMRAKPREKRPENEVVPFLQRPVMVYVFALLLVAACGIHQYTMAFIFALERGLGDYLPAVVVGSLLLLEIMRHWGKRFGVAEFVVSCVPFAATMLAIHQKSVIESGQLGLGIMCYPPVILALSGLALAVLALYHRWYPLLAVPILYGLGVILTAGFTPEYPHDLNIHVCVGLLIGVLLVYGIIIRKPYVCLAGIIVLCIGLGFWDDLPSYVESYQLTDIGVIAGVCGLGCMAIYLLFGSQLHKAVRVFGAFCLAVFVFDYLPEYAHWRYMIVFVGMGFIIAILWFRTREVLAMVILCTPFLMKLYILAKHIAHWRFIIMGFMLLVVGAIVSLLKRSLIDQQNQEHELNDKF
jgi:hypothetical protein